MTANASSSDFSNLSLTTDDDDASDALAHSHQISLLDHSNADTPHTGSTSCTRPQATTDSGLQLHKTAPTIQHLQAIAASLDVEDTTAYLPAGDDNAREDMHLFIDHIMDLSSFTHVYPSFHPQTIRRVMHRVASRMPLLMRVADVLTPEYDQMGLPVLRWTCSSGLKYFLSDAQYNFLFDSDWSKRLGQMPVSKVVELTQTAEHIEILFKFQDLLRRTSAPRELVSFNRNTPDCKADHGQPSCTSDPVEAEPTTGISLLHFAEPTTGAISLLHFLIGETSRLLAYIPQRQREWVEAYERMLDATQTLRFALAVQGKERTERLARRDKERTEFLAKAGLQPPPVLRVIDIKSTCQAKKVVLVDYWAREVQQVGFSAISHTYGMDVYDVFNCQCTTKVSSACVNPRCLVGPCPHNATVSQQVSEMRNRVVNDILGMCENLCKAGVEYAWHDGVCIAQHDDAEVVATIKCMGWVYASARETIIFLHYVGKPIAPIRPGKLAYVDGDDLTCRWHTRVWTLQEAALSKCRRYCVRVGNATGPLGECQNLEEFEKEIGLWYKDESSKVEVIEEDRFLELLWEVYTALAPLLVSFAQTHSIMDLDIMDGLEMWMKAGNQWGPCLYKLMSDLLLEFPSAKDAIVLGANRQSKHVGDHINSILALTGVRDFVAPKDEDMEGSTIEFFKRQKQPGGLARALFSANTCLLDEDVEKHMREVRRHTWPPLLWKMLSVSHEDVWDFASAPIQFRVQEDGKLEVRGELLCMAVRFMAEQGRLVVDRRKEMSKFFDINYKPKEFCRDDSRPYLKMCITVLPHLSRFRATAPEDAYCDLGIANVLMYYDYGQMSSSSSDRSSSSDLKRIDQIRDGESFDAHLVLPMHHYRLAVEERRSIRVTLLKRNGYECKVLPVLVVQGNSLHDPVSKIGCFVPTFVFIKSFEDILFNHQDEAIQFPAFTFVDKIVII